VEDNEVILPHKLFLEWPEAIEAVKQMKTMYSELVSLGVPREDVRFLLPEGMSTNMTMTMNFRSLRHFLKLRLHPTAQWEIRQLASQIANICLQKWPWLIEDIVNARYSKDS
jgi:thymidylate synthase (FAD)